METKLSFPLQSLSQPSLSSTGKNSVEWYKMKAIIFPVVTIFSQNFLPDKQKRFLSYRTASKKAEKPMLLIQIVVEVNLMFKVVPTLKVVRLIGWLI